MFYVYIVTINLLLCSVSAGSIYFFFHYPLSLLLTHTVICLYVFLLGVIFSITSNRVRRASTATFLQPLFFSLASTVFIFVYLGNFASNYFWKANLNFNLLGRILNHYFGLYQAETILIVCGATLLVFLPVAYIYHKTYKTTYCRVERPGKITFILMSLLVFTSIQAYNFYYKSTRKVLENYIYGDLILDLFNDYTDSNNDYLTDADVVSNSVQQSVNYVEQKSTTVNFDKKNIIVIIVDCLRADHLPNYGYDRNTTPFVSDFIDTHNGVLVDHFFAMCDESKCGIRSILTSRGFGVQNSSQAIKNSLHSILKEDGYQINFLLSSDHGFGGLKKTYYPYDFYLDGLGFKKHPLNDDRGIISALEDWPTYNGSPNYFHFHLFSAHEAGIGYGRYSGQAVLGIKPGFLVENPINPRYSTPDASDNQASIDMQDNKIFQADLVISRIISLLKNKGYMDNTLVVITGDHGQGLNEHGYRGHISGLYNESLRIPLILIDTAGTLLSITERSFGTQLDIAPTILDIMGKSIPESWQGQRLQDKKTRPKVTQHVIPNRSSSFAKIYYDPIDGALYKYMFLSSIGGLKEESYFFDLLRDPDEKNNLLEISENQEKYLNIITSWSLDKFDG
jgi:glucan phosphoethanolaminetransferase (alkaline phosphatase superfamily)